MRFKRTRETLPNHEKPRSGKQVKSGLIDNDKYTSVIFQTKNGVYFSAYGTILEKIE